MQSYTQKVKSIILEDRKVLDREFNQLALELFDHQIANNEVYRKIYKSRSFAQPNHWTEIPLITTDSFKKFKFFCGQDSEIITTFYSSGTSTGDRSIHYLSQRELELYELSLWASFSKAFGLDDLIPSASPLVGEGGKLNDKVHYLILTESAKEKPNSSLIHMFEVVRRKLNASEDCFYYKDEQFQAQKLITKLKELENTETRILIVATAFSFVHFLDSCEDNFHLPSNTMLMETGGYKGKSREIPKEELYQQLSKKLNVQFKQIIGQYGMSELCTQFYDTASSPKQKNIPPWSKIRILNPNNLKEEVKIGEQGLIAIYDLCNIDSCPFILTGDIGIKRQDSLELLGRSSQISQKGCSLNYG